jgi:hypothetical protein
VKDVVKTGMTAMKGESPTQLIDRLGARLAFERSGVRLYEALLSKLDASGIFDGGPSREDIERIVQDRVRVRALSVARGSARAPGRGSHSDDAVGRSASYHHQRRVAGHGRAAPRTCRSVWDRR